MTMRNQRAPRRKVCDGCKRRKVRCDGHEGSLVPCTSCRTFHIPCTYIGVTRPKETPKDYVQLLEKKIDDMAALLAQHISPDEMPDDCKPKPPSTDLLQGEPVIRPFIQNNVIPWMSPGYRKELDGISSSDDESDHDQGRNTIGNSSNTALPLKEELTPDTYSSLENFAYTPDDPVPLDQFQRIDAIDLNMPSPDVASPLFTSFFSHVTPFLPIVDQTTFLEQYAQASQSHMCHPSFTVLVRLVCAIGDFHQSDGSITSASGKQHNVPGYEFFRDTKDAMSLGPPGLADIQCRTLAGLYYHLLGDTHASWIELSVGIRLGQSVGAHRKPSNASLLQPREDWIRVFWCLIHLDRHTSRELGRLPVMRMMDYDLPLPTGRSGLHESDDDINYFLFLLWTDRIFVTTQTQASIARKPVFWTQITAGSVADLDRETEQGMNRLLNNLPVRWRWDPECPGLIRLAQSAQLFCAIHYTSILHHRLRFEGDSPTPDKNLDRSINSAQSVSSMVLVCARRRARMLPHAYSVVFVSAIVLLTAIWFKRKQNQSRGVEDLVDGVRRCIEALRLTETWLAAAGRYVDILRHLALFGDLSIDLDSDRPSIIHAQPSSFSTLFDQQSSSTESLAAFDSSATFSDGQFPSSFMASYPNHGVPLLEDWFSQTQSNNAPAFWGEWLADLNIIDSPMDM